MNGEEMFVLYEATSVHGCLLEVIIEPVFIVFDIFFFHSDWGQLGL